MKRFTGFTAFVAAAGLWAGAWAAEDSPLELKTETDRVNYSLGYQIGGDFKRQGLDLDPATLVRGIRDAMEAGGQDLMGFEGRQQALIDLKRKVLTDGRRKQAEEFDRRRREGQAFLAGNAKKEGVVTLPSGLQYRVIAEGRGRAPEVGDTVTVNYRGTLVDGTEFDSSQRQGEPASFPLGNVIAGWQEALPLMQEGAQWQLVVPPDLAYGEGGPLAHQTLLFDIELVSVTPDQGEPAPR
jgi:FKBP-type peptidyl-prolyl cis-trans isomerase FklB